MEKVEKIIYKTPFLFLNATLIALGVWAWNGGHNDGGLIHRGVTAIVSISLIVFLITLMCTVINGIVHLIKFFVKLTRHKQESRRGNHDKF